MIEAEAPDSSVGSAPFLMQRETSPGGRNDGESHLECKLAKVRPSWKEVRPSSYHCGSTSA